jgi:N-acetylmuramoyl-L-alanine amidase
MASQVQDQMRIRAKRKDGGVRQGPFLVLWRTTMPSVLIETGYITNEEEEKYLNTDYGQDIIASAIYRAFRNYKEETEARTSAENIAEESEIIKPQSSVAAETIIEKTGIGNPEDNISLKRDIEEKEVTPVKKDETIKEPVNNNELLFRIQVLASREPIKNGSPHFKGETDLEEFHIDGFYKYMTRPVYGYSQSQELRKKLDAKFPGAFVIAYLNGKSIPLQEAIKLEKEK